MTIFVYAIAGTDRWGEESWVEPVAWTSEELARVESDRLARENTADSHGPLKYRVEKLEVRSK